jgi:outer membrane protein TolC
MSLQLSMKDAVAIALAPEGSVRLQLANELLHQARARSDEARAALLPNVSAYVGEQNTTRNLQAYGLGLNFLVPGIAFPTLVGPFNIFDARASATQTVLNLGSVRRYQAAKTGVGQAEAEIRSAQDGVRAQVASAYMAAVREEAALEATQADVRLAEAVLKLAADQKAAGTGLGIDVTRAGVQLADQKQRLLVAQNRLTTAHLQLLRAMHLDLDARVELLDKLTRFPAPSVSVQQALHDAFEGRADWQAQQKRLEAARLQQSAARMDRLPSIGVFADYGTIGTGLDNSIPTRTYGFNVQIPVFDGGRVDARRAEANSQYRQELIRSEDLRAQIELEVRLALDSLQSASDQVRTAEEGLALAENEVAQAERRYSAGASAGLEVTDAQTRLERARENRIAALFAFNIARINLAAATGAMRQLIQ